MSVAAKAFGGIVLLVVGGVWLANLNDLINEAEDALARQRECGDLCRGTNGESIHEVIAHNEALVAGWRTMRYIPSAILVGGAALLVMALIGYAKRDNPRVATSVASSVTASAATPRATPRVDNAPSEAPLVSFGCMHCGAAADDGANFCARCGKALPPAGLCPRCAQTVAKAANFCSGCGLALVVSRNPSA